MSNATPLMQLLRHFAVDALIIFSLIMLVSGLLGLIFGRLSVGHFKFKGVAFRILSAVLFLGAAGYFIPKYGLLVEIVLALVVVVIGLVLAEKLVGRAATAGGDAYLPVRAG